MNIVKSAIEGSFNNGSNALVRERNPGEQERREKRQLEVEQRFNAVTESIGDFMGAVPNGVELKRFLT